MPFERSTDTDIWAAGQSYPVYISLCTSKNSYTFLRSPAFKGKYILSDNIVDGWKNPDGAVIIQANSDAGLVRDSLFLNPPSANPPIFLEGKNQYATHGLMMANVQSPQTDEIFRVDNENEWGSNGNFVIPVDQPSPAILDSSLCSFQRACVTVPQLFFNVRECGARGDNSTDDTAAIQACVDKAKEAGGGSAVYFPFGRYVVTRTINIRGDNYRVWGDGYYTEFIWRGGSAGPIFSIESANNIELLALNFSDNGVPVGTTAIKHQGSGMLSSIFYDRLLLPASSRKLEPPIKQGLVFSHLTSHDNVQITRIRGGIVTIEDSTDASIFMDFYDGSGLYIHGKPSPQAKPVYIAIANSGDIQVYDNNSLIIGALYIEQSGNLGKIGPTMNNIHVAGNIGDPNGKVVMGGVKFDSFDTDLILSVDNYGGLVSYAFAILKPSTGGFDRYRFEQTGTRSVDLHILGITNTPYVINQQSATVYDFPTSSGTAVISQVQYVLNEFYGLNKVDASMTPFMPCNDSIIIDPPNPPAPIEPEDTFRSFLNDQILDRKREASINIECVDGKIVEIYNLLWKKIAQFICKDSYIEWTGENQRPGIYPLKGARKKKIMIVE